MRARELANKLNISYNTVTDSVRKRGAPHTKIELDNGKHGYDFDQTQWCEWYLKTADPTHNKSKKVIKKIKKLTKDKRQEMVEAIAKLKAGHHTSYKRGHAEGYSKGFAAALEMVKNAAED